MKTSDKNLGLKPWQRKLHDVIFEAETPTGKWFDVLLLVAILTSVIVVILESVPSIDDRFHDLLVVIEWFFTILFTIEYILRLLCVRRPTRYARSFFGVVDLLSILPTYMSLLIPGSQELLVIRGLRLLRIFRIFKLARYLGEADALLAGLRASRIKITVFLMTILISVTIMGALMHLVEGPAAGFVDIPHGIYWAIVTMTTVGFGDITPQTGLGKMIASLMMIFGYSLIIVPTGIISAEIAVHRTRPGNTETCPHCMKVDHAKNAKFCDRCGGEL
ncbi:MAG: ion transporter [Planctomycetota bacterium]